MVRFAGPMIGVRIPRRNLNFLHFSAQAPSGSLFESVRSYHHRSWINSSLCPIAPCSLSNGLPRLSHSSRHRLNRPPSSAPISFNMRRRRVQNKPPVGQTSQRDGAPEHKGLPASLSDQEITAEGDISERITSRDPAKEGDSHGGIEERTLSEPPEESTPNESAGESIPIKSAEETVQSEATRGVTSGSNPGHEITSNSESAEEIPPQSESAQEITLKSESGIMPKIKSTHRSGRKPTGAMLIKMIEAVERMSEDQKAKHITQAGFPPWAAANFNRPHLNPTRFIRILRNPQWRRILQQYCLTSYGRASLELSIIHRIVNSELDHVSSHSHLRWHW